MHCRAFRNCKGELIEAKAVENGGPNAVKVDNRNAAIQLSNNPTHLTVDDDPQKPENNGSQGQKREPIVLDSTNRDTHTY
jgi:hypothetical protein